MKTDGYLYTTGLPKLFFWFLSSGEIQKIKQKMEKILNQKIKDKDDKWYGLFMSSYYVRERLIGEPHDKIEEAIQKWRKYMTEIRDRYTESIVKKYNFTTVMSKYMRTRIKDEICLMLKKNKVEN